MREEYEILNKAFLNFVREFKIKTRMLSSTQLKHMRRAPDFTMVPVN